MLCCDWLVINSCDWRISILAISVNRSLGDIDGRLILTAEVAKIKMEKTTKLYLLKYILLVLAILFFTTSAVRVSLPIFCILNN